jgi:hypothetical protein
MHCTWCSWGFQPTNKPEFDDVHSDAGWRVSVLPVIFSIASWCHRETSRNPPLVEQQIPKKWLFPGVSDHESRTASVIYQIIPVDVSCQKMLLRNDVMWCETNGNCFHGNKFVKIAKKIITHYYHATCIILVTGAIWPCSLSVFSTSHSLQKISWVTITTVAMVTFKTKQKLPNFLNTLIISTVPHIIINSY